MRNRALMALAVWGTVATGVACAPKPVPKPKAPPPPPPGQLGETCTPNRNSLAQGTCAVGLLCMPMAGGFCASMCPCGQGAVCAPSPTAFEMCMKSCTSDGDCAGAMVCNPDWKACAPPDLLAGKPPACTEAAPPRKLFGKVTPVTKGGRPTYEPTAILDKNGDLAVVYVDGIPVGVNGLTATTLSFASETPVAAGEKALSLARDNVTDPVLGRDRDGKLYLTYLGFRGGVAVKNQMTVGLTTSEDGVTWSAPVVAGDLKTDCPDGKPGCLDRPTIAVGPDRDNRKKEVVYVFYWSTVSQSLRATHSNDGGATFSPSVKVGDGPFAEADVSSSGKLHVVYVAGEGNKMGDTKNGVYYTSSSDGGDTFAPPVRISPEGTPVPIYFSSPRVVVDVPRRLLYAVYTSGGADGKWQIVLATSKDAGVTWSTQKVNDDPDCATHMMPAARLDPANGKIHVIWAENRAGAGEIAYASCVAGGDRCSKNEVVSDTPFAAFKYTRSMGDYLALVVDSRHRLAHALWTQPVEEGGAVVSRIFHASAKIR